MKTELHRTGFDAFAFLFLKKSREGIEFLKKTTFQTKNECNRKLCNEPATEDDQSLALAFKKMFDLVE